jgi:hypothetical protein
MILVCLNLISCYSYTELMFVFFLFLGGETWQNVKAVFDAAIKVVLQPPKQTKKKKKKQKNCTIL